MSFVKTIIFVVATLAIAFLSRASLRDRCLHGFYRFFAWELILVLILINIDYWFVEPFAIHQIVAWALLFLSLFFVIHSVLLLRLRGKPSAGRDDEGLLGIEKTTELVTAGAYRFIRHPMYSSLLYLAWGVFFKHPSLIGGALAFGASLFLTLTAKMEEKENVAYWGEPYRSYMKETKMFIPYLF